MKQVAMPFLLDNDVEAPSAEPQHPATDLVRTYLTNAGSRFFSLRSSRREPTEPVSVHDLWDHLGDFA
jgi:hypothetical protein